MLENSKPILELPAALVNELLQKNEAVGKSLLDSIREIQENKNKMRDWLVYNKKLKMDSDLPEVEIPTTCGIDGSFAIERLLSTSIVVCAAVAVEGFTPPSEKKHWPLKHDSLIEIETHESELGTILRGIMKIMETKLAIYAPHDVVLLDGSITSQIIHMHQAITSTRDEHQGKTKVIGSFLESKYADFLTDFQTILESSNEKKIWASIPKFTTRNELGLEYDKKNGWPQKQDDRSVLTVLLKPHEFTIPIPITRDNDKWHLPHHEEQEIDKIRMRDEELMSGQFVFYYKPHDFTPALRIEIAESIKKDNTRMSMLLRSLQYQYSSYAIMEPYPLYMADRMVKNLSSAIPTLRQSALQNVVGNTDAELKDILYSMRSYRTEGGR